MKKASALFLICISLSGCFVTFSESPPCPPQIPFQNVVIVRFHVTDKETGLPIKGAAIYMRFVKFTWEADAVMNCFPKRIAEGEFLIETNDVGFCEISFTTDYRTPDDSYTIHYSGGKQLYEKVDGTSNITRMDAERSIEIKLLNNTTQP